MQKIKRREIWVDNIKVVACILVAIGHFFMGMITAEMMPDSGLQKWFIQTIYYFHVPLFFIASGYLYQKVNCVTDVRSWGKNILKKLLTLGIPYFVFSFVTWALKTFFSSSVNTPLGGLADTLFIHPAAPYWYLYALFFVFLITPTFRNKKMAVVGLIIALALKSVEIFLGGCDIKFIAYILADEIWFVIGMCLSVFDLKRILTKCKLYISTIMGIIFVILSVWIFVEDLHHELISFGMGILACGLIIAMIGRVYENREQSKIFKILSQYTMPIFLMHTIFAATLRTVLLRIGIENIAVHVILGISISFAGPIIVGMLMKKVKWLEVFLYPEKVIKGNK